MTMTNDNASTVQDVLDALPTEDLRDELRRRERVEAVTAAPVVVDATAGRCPDWCAQAHPSGVTRDFHHDSEPRTCLVGPDVADALLVTVSQYIPAGGQAWAPSVDLQDEARCVATMTPREAFDLPLALFTAAALAAVQS